VSERPTTAFHRTLQPPAYKRLPVPADYGPWARSPITPRQKLDSYERMRADGLPMDPILERQLERRQQRRTREGRLGPPPEGWNPDAGQQAV
jgi:hypothetical protein